MDSSWQGVPQSQRCTGKGSVSKGLQSAVPAFSVSVAVISLLSPPLHYATDRPLNLCKLRSHSPIRKPPLIMEAGHARTVPGTTLVQSCPHSRNRQLRRVIRL